MDRLKWAAAAGIFLVLTMVKLLIPGAAAYMQKGAAEYLDSGTDYTQVLEDVSEALAPKKSAAVPAAAAEPVKFTPPDKPLRLKSIADISREELCPVTFVISEKPADEPAQEETPQAVQTFLASQSAFADYAVPANVTYDLVELPFSYQQPVAGVSSSGFGYRLHPILGEVKFHYGTDIAANSGTPIAAFAAGTVTYAGYSDSFGNYITIDSGDGWKTLYAHCSELDVAAGDTVAMGDRIALVGMTGEATGPHLHFELSHDGVYVNPEYYVNNI